METPAGSGDDRGDSAAKTTDDAASGHECPECGGAGEVDGEDCLNCGGTGRAISEFS